MKDFENSLESMMNKAELLLLNGVSDAKSYFHTPTISTFDEDGISSRTVVLREYNSQDRFLRFHTDYRSPKIHQINLNQIGSVHAYDHEEKIQIRLKGKLEVFHQDAITEKAWKDTREMSKECYSVIDAPSKKIKSPEGFDIDSDKINREDGYKNFAVNLFRYDYLEILYLKRSGHRRASFKWSKEKIEKNWLIP